MQIWKYPLALIDSPQLVEMPEGARILSVQEQQNRICVWALVDPEAKKVSRKFHIFGTGNQLDASGVEWFQFLGTVVMSLGVFVWHVFEEMK